MTEVTERLARKLGDLELEDDEYNLLCEVLGVGDTSLEVTGFAFGFSGSEFIPVLRCGDSDPTIRTPSTGGGPKFCSSCGAVRGSGKFCAECGRKA